MINMYRNASRDDARRRCRGSRGGHWERAWRPKDGRGSCRLSTSRCGLSVVVGVSLVVSFHSGSQIEVLLWVEMAVAVEHYRHRRVTG